jgi:uncharacterized Tic20 family protein
MSTPSDQIPPSPPPPPYNPPPPSPPYNPPPPSPPPYSANAPYEPIPPVAHNNDDKNLAMLTHLSGFILSVIVPLIVWLINKDKPEKAYLVAESKEALNFQITVLLGYVICWILTIILIGAFLQFVLWILNIVFCIIAAVKVSQNGTYRYPFALRLIN